MGRMLSSVVNTARTPFVVLDPHPIVARAIADRVAHELPGKEVGIFHSPQEMVGKLKGRALGLLICDLDWPDGGLIMALNHLRKTNSAALRIFGYTALPHVVAHWFLKGLRANGYSSKRSPLGSFIPALRAVVQGADCFIPEKPAYPKQDLPAWEDLTKRERDILVCLSQGQEMKTMRRELGIEVSTIETHLRNLRAKLGVSSKRELERIAQTFQRVKNTSSAS